MVALGFLVGLWTASRRGLRDGVPGERVLDIGPWLIMGAILGARAIYVATFWRDQFAGKPVWEIVAGLRGGRVFFRRLGGMSLGILFFASRNNMSGWEKVRVFAPSTSAA